MSSTSTMPPNTTNIPCTTEWPALSPSKITSSRDQNGLDSDWELIPEANECSAEKSFDSDQPILTDMEQVHAQSENATKKSDATENKPHCLKHAQSTPDFRRYNTIFEESDPGTEAALIEDGVDSLASSSMVIVSGPSSVISSQSVWSGSSRISFRDAIMKENSKEVKDQATNGEWLEDKVEQPKIMKKKPKFVVKPIRRCSKSTGDLQSLARIVENDDDDDLYNNDMVVGDTDAELYYNRKAQGKLGRKNGRKIRPDEAKRLQITMAKKDIQRQQQQSAASKKR